MAFVVYLKETEGNEISNILETHIKKFNVATLEISNGLLKKGSYYIPVEHILFIKEV